MFARLLVTAAIASGLLATDAMALAGSTAASMFKGRTSQGYPVKVLAKERKLRLIRFEADLRCRDGSTVTLVESGFLWTPTTRGGGFRDAQFGRTDRVYFRGRMSGGRVRGRVRLTDAEKGSPRCRSHWIPFNARAR